jgi:hypothetical protein
VILDHTSNDKNQRPSIKEVLEMEKTVGLAVVTRLALYLTLYL